MPTPDWLVPSSEPAPSQPSSAPDWLQPLSSPPPAASGRTPVPKSSGLQQIGDVLHRLQGDVANAPGFKQAGDVIRSTLQEPQPVRVFTEHGVEPWATPLLDRGYTLSADGTLVDPTGRLVTTDKLQMLLTATVPAGPAPGAKAAQNILQRVAPRIVPREGGLIGETQPVRGAVERGVQQLTGTPVRPAIPAAQSAAETAKAAQQGLHVLPQVGARLAGEGGPSSATPVPYTHPIQPPGSVLHAAPPSRVALPVLAERDVLGIAAQHFEGIAADAAKGESYYENLGDRAVARKGKLGPRTGVARINQADAGIRTNEQIAEEARRVGMDARARMTQLTTQGLKLPPLPDLATIKPGDRERISAAILQADQAVSNATNGALSLSQLAQRDDLPANAQAYFAQLREILTGQRAAPPLTMAIPRSPELATALQNERGAMNLKPIADYLDRQHSVNVLSGDLADKLNQIKRQGDASAVEVRRILRTVGKDVTPQDWETVYHAMEAPASVELTPRQRSLLNVMTAIQDTTAAVKQTLPQSFRPITEQGYVRRFATGVGSMIDRAVAEVRGGGTGGLLRQSLGSFKPRVMISLTNLETGARAVGRRVGETIQDAGGRVLGELAPLKLQSALMSEDLAPLQQRLTELAQTAKSVETIAAQAPERATAVLGKVGDNLRAIDEQLARISTWANPDRVAAIRQERQQVEQMLQTWKEAGTGDLTALRGRVQSLNTRMQKTIEQIGEIHFGYDPRAMESRIFKAKNGVQYRLGQATTREVEAQTGVRYYKNALVSTLLDHQETLQAARANAFLESLKQDPDFLKVAVPRSEAYLHPKNWRAPQLAPLRDFVMEPRVAAVFDQVARNMDPREPGTIIKGLEFLNRQSVAIGFANPLIHTPNVAMNWTLDRGTMRWLNPVSYKRLVQSSVRAFNAAAHINDDYLNVLRAGGGVMRENSTALRVRSELLDMARRELRANPNVLEGMLTQLGRPVKDFLNSPWWLSHHITWFTNDMAYLQRVFERQLEGMSLGEAITDTDRFILNYRLPATVLGNETLSRVLSNRNVVIFAPYHYGVLKAWGQMAKGLLGAVPLRQRAEAADKLAMAGLIMFGVLPAADHVAKTLTGNQRTTVRRAGLLSPVSAAIKWQRGELPPDWAIESVVSPSPGVGSAINVVEQRGRWTNPAQSQTENIVTALKMGAQGMLPLSIRQMVAQGKSIPTTILSPILATPKFSPAENAVRQWPFNRAKFEAIVTDLQIQNKDAEAERKAQGFNDRLRKLVTQAAQDEGVPKEQIPGMVDDYVNQYGIRLRTPGSVDEVQQRKTVPFSIPNVTEPRQRPPRTFEPGPPP